MNKLELQQSLESHGVVLSDINLDNLKLTIESLNRLPSDVLFNLENWVVQSNNTSDPDMLKASNPDKDIHSCGTVCCAFGWLATDPLVESVYFEYVYNPSYENYSGWSAAYKFVGNGWTSRLIFDMEFYEDRQATQLVDVIERIELIIEIIQEAQGA